MLKKKTPYPNCLVVTVLSNLEYFAYLHCMQFLSFIKLAKYIC